jgi:hypothetical protein
MDKQEMKEFALRQIESLVFSGQRYTPAKVIGGSNKNTNLDPEDEFLKTNSNNLLIKNLLTKKVSEHFKLYKEKGKHNLYIFSE